MDKAIVTFKKKAILQQLKQRLRPYYRDTSLYWNYKNELHLQQLLEQDSSQNLYLKDSFIYLPDTFYIYPSYQENRPPDSFPIVDKQVLSNNYSQALSFLILSILENEDIRVFNKTEKEWEAYISYQYWSMYPVGIATSGKVYCFSNDSLLYDIILTLGF